jgi:alkaline phosphatase
MSSRARLRALLLSLLYVLALTSFAAARPEADSAILFIGDGMGPNQIELAAGALGQPLTMQRFPYSGTVATCNAKGDVTDSAAAATVLATGVKTKNGVLGLSPDGRKLESILELARARGKSVGVITTDALWGATPSGFLVHVGSRGERGPIALQMAKSGAQVMLGYWNDWFLPKSAGGKREDGRDLVTWLRKMGYGVVETREKLLASKSLSLVGLFDDGPQAPQLADLVSAALPRLCQNPRGFILVVEAARVDWASHESDPVGVVLEMRQLEGAVSVAEQEALRRGRILVVVTADHETGGLMITNPDRLGALRGVTMTVEETVKRLNPERTDLSPLFSQAVGIHDLTPQEGGLIKEAKDPAVAIRSVLSVRAGVRWTSEGDHTSTPVRVFATGPGAARFTGEMDNTQIPSRIADALGIGPFPRK